MGRDVNNMGKAVFLKPKTPVAPQIKTIVPQTTVAVPAPLPSDKAKPANRNFLQGMWDGIFAPKQAHALEKAPIPAHSDFTLNNLQPRIVKKDLLSSEEKTSAMALEDVPEKTDIQEVPAAVENAPEGTGLDVDGDGIVDVRYHQRQP